MLGFSLDLGLIGFGTRKEGLRLLFVCFFGFVSFRLESLGLKGEC